MNKNPIILIDDDEEDLAFLSQAFSELNVENEIIVFNDSNAFLDYIRTTEQKTFFILCDINMPGLGGLELKQKISDDERLRWKCIPFIFLSTSSASTSVMRAYSFGVQGYFTKPHTLNEMKSQLLNIMNYWDISQHPNQ